MFPVVVSPATTSPLSSLFSLLRSVVVAALLYGFCLGAINVSARTVALLPCLSLSNYLAVSPHLSLHPSLSRSLSLSLFFVPFSLPLSVSVSLSLSLSVDPV